MPRGDGTGPVGLGPMTGAGAGRCAGNGARGRAGGYGCRRMYHETGLPGWVRYGEPLRPEKETLSREADLLESRLKQVREKMTALAGESREEKEGQKPPETEAQ